MLSRKDIEKELGTGINIYPLHCNNIKGNSINFSVGQNAWSLSRGQIVKDKNGKWVLAPKVDNGKKKIDIMTGDSAIIHDGKRNILILLGIEVLLSQSTLLIVNSHWVLCLHLFT